MFGVDMYIHVACLHGEEKWALLEIVCVMRAPETTKALSPLMVIGRCYLLSLCITGKFMAVFLLLHLLVLLAGDVETNPGPITGESGSISFADARLDHDVRTFLYQNQTETCHLEYSNTTLILWHKLLAEVRTSCPLSSWEWVWFQGKNVRKSSFLSKPPYRRATFSWQPSRQGLILTEVTGLCGNCAESCQNTNIWRNFPQEFWLSMVCHVCLASNQGNVNVNSVGLKMIL